MEHTKISTAAPEVVVEDSVDRRTTSGDAQILVYAGPHPHKHFLHRSNWLRAAVLGANDGLVSVASLTIGVAGSQDLSSTNAHALLIASVAGLVAGALSMAAGEFMSVSSQRDIEIADVEKEKAEQAKGPEAQARELAELCQIYIDRGVSPDLAAQVARQLTEKDVIRAHARDELGIDIDDFTNPYSASLASALAFSVGAFVPIIPLLIPDISLARQIIGVVVAVSIALVLFGMTGAAAGGAPLLKGTVRVLFFGWVAMAVTYGVGNAFNSPPVA